MALQFVNWVGIEGGNCSVGWTWQGVRGELKSGGIEENVRRRRVMVGVCGSVVKSPEWIRESTADGSRYIRTKHFVGVWNGSSGVMSVWGQMGQRQCRRRDGGGGLERRSDCQRIKVIAGRVHKPITRMSGRRRKAWREERESQWGILLTVPSAHQPISPADVECWRWPNLIQWRSETWISCHQNLFTPNWIQFWEPSSHQVLRHRRR